MATVSVNQMSEQQAALASLLKHLTEAREKKTTGTLVIRIELIDGGIRDRWVETKARDR